ncbi:helix-turn-helix domain-containing protein [Methylobacterium sp. E-066]|uniref:helix-turn-helix domain-containing protein n=1 Tax=Methylobacterium sp. E-066 TaxID=2836584 RepID=UPI001FBB8377|nr:helix-turn-helix domain-containing protein [Methylobacterium sp. E-066]MCJ2142415.1 helix-turn-helix domain-containing protein [Methylobacterium sp. E-066]
MNYTDEIRRQVEAAPRAALPAVTAALWRAYSEGKVTEAEAEALSGLIEARTLSTGRPRSEQTPNPTETVTPQTGDPTKNVSGLTGAPRRPGVGSRPRTDASMERRRRWAASGRMPQAIVARFTLAEQAVLSLVAAEVARRKDCRLSIENMAAVAGVCRSTVKNAIREAARLGLLTVEERQITGFRNDTNIVRIVSPEWLAWLRLARKGNTAWPTSAQGEGRHGPTFQRGGVKSVTSTPTEVPDLGKTRPAESKKGCRQAAGDLDRSGQTRIRASGRAGRAMR